MDNEAYCFIDKIRVVLSGDGGLLTSISVNFRPT